MNNSDIFSNFKVDLKNYNKKTLSKIDKILSGNTLECAGVAKRLAATDEGTLKENISANVQIPLHKEVNVNVYYAAYVEFGTGKYAAQYVASIPPDWKQMALQFKGKAGGDYYDFLNNILDWVKRKGLAKIKNSYTGKSSTKKSDILIVAEAIAFYIMVNGTRAHPFLLPAYQIQKKQLIEDFKNIL